MVVSWCTWGRKVDAVLLMRGSTSILGNAYSGRLDGSGLGLAMLSVVRTWFR